MDIFDRKLYHILRFFINLNDEINNKNYPKEIPGLYMLQQGYSLEEIEETCVEVNVILNMLGTKIPEQEIKILAEEATKDERLKKVIISWLFTVLSCSLYEPNEDQLDFIKYMIASLDIESSLEEMVDEGDQRGYFLLRYSAAFYMEGFHNKFLEKGRNTKK